jgi:hypothetical protein
MSFRLLKSELLERKQRWIKQNTISKKYRYIGIFFRYRFSVFFKYGNSLFSTCFIKPVGCSTVLYKFALFKFNLPPPRLYFMPDFAPDFSQLINVYHIQLLCYMCKFWMLIG